VVGSAGSVGVGFAWLVGILQAVGSLGHTPGQLR